MFRCFFWLTGSIVFLIKNKTLQIIQPQINEYLADELNCIFKRRVTDNVTHTRASGGGAFPAVGDVGLVGVVGVAQQGAGGWSAAASWGAGFTELDSTFLFRAVLCCGCLTPLGMSHPWGDVLADYRHRTEV